MHFPLGSLLFLSLLVQSAPATISESSAVTQPNASSHDAIEARRQRIEDIRARHLKNPGDIAIIIELAGAYRQAGQLANAVAVLSAAINDLPAEAYLDNAELILTWGQWFIEWVAPDHPDQVGADDLAKLYRLACALPPGAVTRERALLLLAHLHYLARKRTHDLSWWSDLVVQMEQLYPGLPVRGTWNHETDDCRRHILAALYATRDVVENDADNSEALLLGAVLNLDLNQQLEAFTSFRRAFEQMGAGQREPFFSSELLATADEFATLTNETERASFWTGFWMSHAPEPGALLNSAQLEFWRRAALAGFYYGPPQGWLHLQGHPARVLIRIGEPDEIEIVPHWSQMDASENFDLARSPGAKEVFTCRVETRGDVKLSYDQAGDSYRLQPASASQLDEISNAEPIQLASISERRAEFFADHVTIASPRECREHLAYALMPLGDDPEWWRGGLVRLEIYDAQKSIVSSLPEQLVSEADIISGPTGAMLLGASELPGLPPGSYSASIRLTTGQAQAIYDMPFEVSAVEDSRALRVSSLEFAYGHYPLEGQPHFDRSDWSYVPNPSRIVACGDADDCGVNIVCDVWNAASDHQGNAVLATQIFIVPQEFLQYQRSLARVPLDGVAPLRCADLDPEFARRAACDPVTGRQDERFLTREMCLVIRSGEFKTNDLPPGWERITVGEITPLRRVDPSGRVIVPLRVDVSTLEPGSYGLFVEVFDRLAEGREKRPVSAVGYSRVSFQIIGGRSSPGASGTER